MKKEERDTLYNNKIADGKSIRQANEEIRELEYSQKIIFKEKDREIKRLNKDIEKLESKLEKERNKQGQAKDFKKQFQLDIERETGSEKKIKEIKAPYNDKETKLATTKDLSRILSLLYEEKEIALGDLTKTCVLNTKVMKNALNFLNKFEIIELIKGRSTIIKLKINQNDN